MADKRDIFNLTLVHWGDEPVTSPDDARPGPNVINSIYNLVLDDVLKSEPWNDAVREKKIPASADVPAFNYSAIYDFPTDPYCLRVLQVGDEPTTWFQQRSVVPGRGAFAPGLEPTWVVRGRKIFVNSSGALPILYISRIGEGEMGSMLANVFAARLAEIGAFGRTANRGFADDMAKKADRIFQKAVGINAKERAATNPFISNIMMARK